MKGLAYLDAFLINFNVKKSIQSMFFEKNLILKFSGFFWRFSKNIFNVKNYPPTYQVSGVGIRTRDFSAISLLFQYLTTI